MHKTLLVIVVEVMFMSQLCLWKRSSLEAEIKFVSFDRIMEKLVILVEIMGVECLGFLSIFGEP